MKGKLSALVVGVDQSNGCAKFGNGASRGDGTFFARVRERYH